MTLTVIIPAYNRERFIEGCIRSLVAGGVEDTEMLVVDDGSSDNTASIVENLCAEMPFLRLIRQENRGPGGARNTGMREATGDWIWFIDSDDHVVPGAIPYIISSIKAYPGVDTFVISETWTYDDPSKNYQDIPLPPAKADLSGKEVLKDWIFPVWGPHRFVFRRSMLENPRLAFPVKIRHEDEYFGLVLAYFSERMHILDKSVYHYIQHDDSIMSTADIHNAEDIFKIFLAMAEFVDSDAVAPEDRPWLNGRLSRWTVGTLKTYRGKDGYSDVIRPILSVIRKEYNRRSGTLPFHIRFRDNLRMLRAQFRK